MRNEDLRVNLEPDNMEEPIKRILDTAVLHKLLEPYDLSKLKKPAKDIVTKGLDYFTDTDNPFNDNVISVSPIMLVGFKGDDYHYMFCKCIRGDKLEVVPGIWSLASETNVVYTAIKLNNLEVKGLDDEDVVLVFVTNKGTDRFGLGNRNTAKIRLPFDNKLEFFKSIEKVLRSYKY